MLTLGGFLLVLLALGCVTGAAIAGWRSRSRRRRLIVKTRGALLGGMVGLAAFALLA